MAQKINIVGWFLGILCLASCENDLAEVQNLFNYPDPEIELIIEPVITYSDSGIVKTKIYAPEMHRQAAVTNGTDIFPKGVSAEFFNKGQYVESWLDAEYGENRRSKSEIFLSGNVHLYNLEGDTLKAEDLIWDQKENILMTEKYVRIQTAGKLIYGFGFRSKDDFSEWEIKAMKGAVDVED